VDSPSFKSKNEIGTQPAMLCERRRSGADISNVARCADSSPPHHRETARSESRSLD